MTEGEDQPPEGRLPTWATYLLFTGLSTFGAIMGGCVNRAENRTKHEQILGKIEEVRQEMKVITERSRR